MSLTLNGTNGLTMPDGSPIVSGEQVAKAWVNFNGTGTVAIRDSYNVSSITDLGTGSYVVNFTSALPNANYQYAFGSEAAFTLSDNTAPPTTTTLNVKTSNVSAVATDYSRVTVSAFAGQ